MNDTGQNENLSADELELFATINSAMRSRMTQYWSDNRKDIDDECGYTKDLSGMPASFYRDMYDRFGIATRVVELYPSETWGVTPTVYESEDEEEQTPFELAWKHLSVSLNFDSWIVDEESSPIWDNLSRWDNLSGIGRYGVLLLGIDDGKDLSEPISGFEDDSDVGLYTLNVAETKSKQNLLFLRVFDESLVDVSRYEARINHRRYGQPIYYNLTLNDPLVQHTGIGHDSGKEVRVHWSRVIHFADNMMSSEVYGVPRMQPVYYHLQDLRKLLGGSAEMFWQGAFPGISFETHPNLGNQVKVDTKNMKSQVQSYFNGLQRYLSLTGVNAKQLSPTVSDPTSHIERHIDAICIRLGVPKRIFMGSERGELASSQDKDTWEERLSDRRKKVVTPRMIRPFVDRLIQIGILPIPKKGYHVKWVEERDIGPEEKAKIAETRMKAISTYLGSGADSLIAPFDFLVREIGYNKEEAEEILENSLEYSEEKEEEEAAAGVEAEESLKDGQGPQPPQDPKSGNLPEEKNEPPKESATDITGNAGGCGAGGGKGRPGFQKGNSCARGGGGVSFPKSLEGLTHVKSLGGSTGATLVQDKDGNKFVYKTGNSPGHIANEFVADELYRAAGVKVPPSKLYQEGGKTVKLEEYKEDLVELNSLSGDKKKAAIAKVQENFAIDAALGNWDVVGAGQDNIMVDKKGEVWRIDNGGSLAYRAQGALKGTKLDSSMNDFDTMQTPLNAGAYSVFGNLSPGEKLHTLNNLAKKVPDLTSTLNKPEIKKTIAFIEKESGGVNLKSKLMTKLNIEVNHKIKSVTNLGVEPKSPQEKLKTPSSSSRIGGSPGSKLGDGNSVLSHLKKSAPEMALTPSLEKKIKYINPNGVSDGVFYMPLLGTKANSPENVANRELLKSNLPPGTKIKSFWVKGTEKKGYKLTGKGSETAEATIAKLKQGGINLGPGASSVSQPAKPITPKGSSLPSVGGEGLTVLSVGKVLAPNLTENSSFSLESHDPNNGFKPGKYTDKHKDVHFLAAKLTQPEYSAVAAWKGSAKGIKISIAKGEETPQAKNFLSALEKAETFQGTTYRGIHGKYALKFGQQVEAQGVGGLWVESTPACSSRGSKTADYFGEGQTMLKIKTKTGAMIEQAGGYEEEQEVTLKGNVTYRINSIHKNATLNVSTATKKDTKGFIHDNPKERNNVKYQYFIELEEL